MTRDRDRVQRRSADELRYLKDHIRRIRSDPRVLEASDTHDSAGPRFTLEALRDGVLIDGYPCRITVGTVALLRGTQSRCMGYGGDDHPLTNYDVAQGVFLICDDTRDLAVSVADDPEALREAVRRFSRTLDARRAARDMLDLLRRVGDALVAEGHTGESSEECGVDLLPDDAWSDDVDLLAHEYGWSDEVILWKIPLVRIVRLKESMAARNKGQVRTSRREKTGIGLLKTIEEVGNELHGKQRHAG